MENAKPIPKYMVVKEKLKYYLQKKITGKIKTIRDEDFANIVNCTTRIQAMYYQVHKNKIIAKE